LSREILFRVVGFALASACSHPAPAPSSVSSAGPQFQARLLERQSQPGKVSLTAHIQIFAPFPAPLEVRILAPPGVTVDGPTEFELPAPRFATAIDRDINLSYATIPQEDLVLIVDVRRPNFGMHAEDVYRFGRSPPEVVAPRATGPRLKVGTVDLGRSVPLSRP